LTFNGIPIGITAVGLNPPSDATTGTTWFDTTLGRLFINYDNYWVDIGSGTGGGGNANFLNVNSDILPDQDATRNIGSPGQQFYSLGVSNFIQISTATIEYASTSGQLLLNSQPLTGPLGPQGPQGPSGAQGMMGGLNYAVTASGVANWIINGSIEPALTLLKGFTYYFNVNSDPLIPFWIKTSPATGTGFAYNNGVTNNGITSGTITFTVPDSAPSTLYYIAQNYGNMQGVISVISNGERGPQGVAGPQGPTGPSADQQLDTTSSVRFSELQVDGSSLFNGPVTFQSTVTYVASTNTYFTDNIISIHNPPGGPSASWTLNDGMDVGLVFRHYNGADTTSALVLDNTNKQLEWFSNGIETNGQFTGTYGQFRLGSIELVNTSSNIRFGDLTVQQTAFLGTGTLVSTAETALTAISANSATDATNVTGGVVTGTVPQNNQSQLQVGYLVVPQISTNSNYTLTLSDQGKHIYSTLASGVQTVTIPDSLSVPFPIGAAISIVLNGNGTININTGSGVSLILSGTSEVGNRTLTTNGMATVMKVENNTWFINGTGLL
jgi:hypothetical protein